MDWHLPPWGRFRSTETAPSGGIRSAGKLSSLVAASTAESTEEHADDGHPLSGPGNARLATLDSGGPVAVVLVEELDVVVPGEALDPQPAVTIARRPAHRRIDLEQTYNAFRASPLSIHS